MERGLANELLQLVDFLNASYASAPFNRVDFREVQRLAGTCATGCQTVDPGPLRTHAALTASPLGSTIWRALRRALGATPAEIS